MYLGMVQQGRSRPFDGAGYGAPQEWSRLWTPGATERKKVVRSADTAWENTRDGRVRVISSRARTDVRAFSVDLYEQQIRAGGRSAKHWHMSDEVCYVISGAGTSLQWDVEAEITDKYRARVADKPGTWDFTSGDLVYVPQNTVHQLIASGTEPLRVLVAQNRLFKLLGYDSVVYLEDASADAAASASAARA